MRIRRPRECYHIVYFRGRFWEVDEGGNLPKGMHYSEFQDMSRIPILYYYPEALLKTLGAGLRPLRRGWYGGFPWSRNDKPLLGPYFGTHRRKALRWLKQRTLSSGHRAIVVNSVRTSDLTQHHRSY